MVKKILSTIDNLHNLNTAPPSLLYQDTPLLTRLLSLSYQYYAELSAIKAHGFIAYLQLFVDSFESVCHEHFTNPSVYHTARQQFDNHIAFDRWQTASSLEPLFKALAQLIQCGIEAYCRADYPPSYQTFLNRLELIFEYQKKALPDQQATVALLLKQLQQKA